MAGRTTQGSAEEREAFMRSIFEKDPNLSIPKANAAFTKKFGSMLRNKKAYQIRNDVLSANRKTSIPVPVQKQPVVVEAGRNPEESIEHAVRRGAAVVEGTPEQLKFFQEAIDSLWSQGLDVLKVDHVTPSYAVVVNPS